MELLIIVAQSQTTFKYHWCQFGDKTIFASTKAGDKSSEQSTLTVVFKIFICPLETRLYVLQGICSSRLSCSLKIL